MRQLSQSKPNPTFNTALLSSFSIAPAFRWLQRIAYLLIGLNVLLFTLQFLSTFFAAAGCFLALLGCESLFFQVFLCFMSDTEVNVDYYLLECNAVDVLSDCFIFVDVLSG